MNLYRKPVCWLLLNILAALVFPITATGQVRLPRLVSDGMVLQRHAEVKIWGWAAASEAVSVHFLDTVYRTQASQAGAWAVMLPPLPAGGPHTMTIRASNTITLTDILVGDVWVCSGQSNMELPMRRVKPLYEQEIARAHYDAIRYFEVPKQHDFQEAHQDLPEGSWQKTTPEQVLNFSAVSFFFAKNLYEKYQVPIGLLNSSLGGSPAEAWMSEEALQAFPAHLREAQRFRDTSLIAQIVQDEQQRAQAWYAQLNRQDQGYRSGQKNWYDPSVNTSHWPTMQVPGYWSATSVGPINGVLWFRKELNLPERLAGQPAELNLGRIVDADSVFVNGEFVGTTGYQYPPRWYTVPAGVLQEGRNTIAIRVISKQDEGGFVLDKPYELVVGDTTVDLKGTWRYQVGAKMEPLASQTPIRWKPLGLYNAMIAPLLNYRIKGVIWYQGESNADNPREYAELFPAMIRDWRKQWSQGDFPFLFVQLANFMEAQEQPGESHWALLREAQQKALALPHTGMAVAIDVGEWNDIHPLNKQSVGHRLALAAQQVAYGEDLVYAGPQYDTMQIEGNKVILSFKQVGSGLMAQGGELQHFAIAGPDHRFVWADAVIRGDQVVVWSDQVEEPVAVRYAWADNPEGANLYNREGLPAAPFRTDTFGQP